VAIDRSSGGIGRYANAIGLSADGDCGVPIAIGASLMMIGDGWIAMGALPTCSGVLNEGALRDGRAD
jgi:hypothetical protein